MKIKAILSKILRIAVLVAMGLLLLATGVAGLLYSSWAQELLREGVVRKMSVGETTLRLDRFRLSFPLHIEADGVALVNAGDTAVAARHFEASVALLPLLTGKAVIDNATATDARYVMGAPDSLMYMTIAADSLDIRPASVRLSDMAITLDEATLKGGRIGMTLRPDTSSAPTPASPPTEMSIALGHIALDDFEYTMRMMPTIDTLRAYIAKSELVGGKIDLLTQKINLGTFSGRGLDARYITPDSAAILAGGPYPTEAELSAQTASDSVPAPWTVEIDSIGFSGSHALYTTAGLAPLPGLDFGYIEVSDVDLRIRNFYNQANVVRLPLTISGTERCGVELDINGKLDIDATALTFDGVSLRTANGTDVAFNGLLGMGDLTTDPDLPLRLWLEGGFDPNDLGLMFPDFSPYLAAIPSADDVLLTADVNGTSSHLDIAALDLRLNNCVNLSADGWLENFMDPDNLGGDISLKGNIINVNSFKNRLLEPATAKTLRVPPMTLNGHVKMNRGTIDGRLVAATGKGRIRLNALWNGNAETYRAQLVTAVFPVQAFMPLLGVGDLTASATVNGRGYDPMKKSTSITADATVARVEYQNVAYNDITLTARLNEGMADLKVASANPDAEFTLTAAGNLDGDVYRWTADLDGSNIDLFALKFSPTPTSLEVAMKADATIGPGTNDMKAHVVVSDLFYRDESGLIGIQDVDARLEANDSLTGVTIHNRDLTATFSSPSPLDSLIDRFSSVSELFSKQIETLFFDLDTIGQRMPKFALDISGGSSNLVNDILAPSQMSISSLHLTADNDTSLIVNGLINRFQTSAMRIDTIYLGARQRGSYLLLNAGIGNRAGNMDEWHKVNIRGIIDGNKLHMGLKQQNLKGKEGFSIGMNVTADAADSTLVLNIRPYNPTIGYQPWTANEDNFISYRIPDHHVDANLHMHGANSSLAIYTEHPADDEGHDGEHQHEQEDLVIQLSDIHIQDWISFNPFAPPVKGDVSTDMRLNLVGDQIVGKGSASIMNLFYGREKVADFKADFDVAATPSGAIRANTDVYVNGFKTMTLSGTLNDSTAVSPLAMDFSMIHFPLSTANPFLPASAGKLRGTLNGTMNVSGTSDRPILDGWIDFDSAAVKLAITGTEYAFSPEKIPVDSSMISFSNFSISGCNANPLRVNGTVDISNFDDMRLNLALKADNMQLVNSTKATRGADVFGKAFIDLDATASGSTQLLRVNADLRIRPETNVTYVIPEATSMISDQGKTDMVKFVNFTDSAAVAMADSLVRDGMAMFLDASLIIDEGSILNVYLSADGKNRAQVQSYGTLDYSMSPLDIEGTLTGRLNIDKGFVRYTPPFMSEKYFSFSEGCYVAFNGDMMNPQINLRAVDVLKANVTQEGQNSRLVNFDVILSVTGTLNQMNVAFDLTTNDDITVANELESMSPEQRANQAMNMLLYNVYTGPGTKANASLSGNPLFSFLESQINTWAANNIKGVDLSFGIDQYDRTVNGNSSSTMSYSYQVSKSLFNDRFKIVVGGNYSTDANADENFSQNLINDISFEYFLNSARSMYLRLFRHTGYESILEGEITQTGVGFVYRRKLRRISDMFLPARIVKARQEKENMRLEQEYLKKHPEKADHK